MCDITFDQSACRVSHVSMHNEPKFIDIKSKQLRILLGNLRQSRQSPDNFGNFRKSSENVQKRSYELRTTIWKWSGEQGRHRFEHEKINFISPSNHVLSSMYSVIKYWQWYTVHVQQHT